MLELEDVKKSYLQANGEGLRILEIPKFEVGTGEQMVLVGRSGCGKTTLLHIIAGIGRADAGSIRIDNVEVNQLSEAALTEIISKFADAMIKMGANDIDKAAVLSRVRSRFAKAA